MMRLILVVLLSVFAEYIAEAQYPEIPPKVQKELSKHFKTELIKYVSIKELSNENDFFLKVYNGDIELGMVVLTSAKGRYDMFDYMVVYNLDFNIELIKVLAYRSQYGSEITAKRWLSQFYSRQEDNLKYGSDIQAISGATFSAVSLTKNINRINKILKEHKGG